MSAVLERTGEVPATRSDWQWDAACMGKDIRLFYGSDQHPLTGKATRPGRAICTGCAVRLECLIDALSKREFIGMRAGFLGHELRRTLRRNGWSIPAALEEYDRGTFGKEIRRAKS